MSEKIVLAYLKAFQAGDIPAIAATLHDDFRLEGPLFTFDSRLSYLESLRGGGLERTSFEVIELLENGESVAAFYTCPKANGTLTVAQLFRFRDNLISETRLVFDTAAMN